MLYEEQKKKNPHTSAFTLTTSKNFYIMFVVTNKVFYIPVEIQPIPSCGIVLFQFNSKILCWFWREII